MIACLIEFAVKPGQEERQAELLGPLMEQAASHPGFLGKETYESRAKAGRLLTISWWRDRAALDAWMRDAAHVRAKVAGRKETLAGWRIRIAEVASESVWNPAEMP